MGVLLEVTTEVMQRQALALGVTLAIRIDKAVPDVVCVDLEKVGWVVTSLVGSALRHVHTPGGSIDLHVTYDTAGSLLTITVRDDGPGIPADRLDKLLNRQHWRPGSALALLLVQDIATAHGGGIQLESRTGADHFTSIVFTIPAR